MYIYDKRESYQAKKKKKEKKAGYNYAMNSHEAYIMLI